MQPIKAINLFIGRTSDPLLFSDRYNFVNTLYGTLPLIHNPYLTEDKLSSDLDLNLSRIS